MARREFEAELFQLDARPLTPGIRVLVKHGTATVQAIVAQIESRYDLDALTHEPRRRSRPTTSAACGCAWRPTCPLEPYRASRHGGSFLVIHPSDGATLAAGIVRD